MNDVLSGDQGYYSWQQLISAPVPYDAMQGSEQIKLHNFSFKKEGKSLCGKNHHVATLGHDPILGWVFGPLNITTRMITFCDMQTYNVIQVNNTAVQRITNKTSNEEMWFKSIDSWKEDDKRLFAAVAKQGMHQESDKHTKYGLQIPIISPDKAQKLLEKGWNSEETGKCIKKGFKDFFVVGGQAGISIIINQIIRALRLLCFDEVRDNNFSTYEVKTQKILSYSNVIASSSNVLYVALSREVNKLDIGGILVTIHRLITDVSFIHKIKMEFIDKEWNNIVLGDDSSF